MSRTEFDEETLAAVLGELSPRHRAAFAAAVCERLLPNYVAFSRETGWGEPEVLRTVLDEVWAFVRGATLASRALREREAQVERATPDTEDFDTYLVSPALDAGAALLAALECVRTTDASKAAEAAGMARDTVDMYVQELEDMSPGDRELEEKILNHPLMVRELERQEADLLALRQAEVIDDALVARLRALGQDGPSNIGLR